MRSVAQLGDEPVEGLTAVARDLEERVDDLADAVGDAERVAAGQGCTRLFLITANDNVDALRCYWRRRFRLVALHPRAVDNSRVSLEP